MVFYGLIVLFSILPVPFDLIVVETVIALIMVLSGKREGYAASWLSVTLIYLDPNIYPMMAGTFHYMDTLFGLGAAVVTMFFSVLFMQLLIFGVAWGQYKVLRGIKQIRDRRLV